MYVQMDTNPLRFLTRVNLLLLCLDFRTHKLILMSKGNLSAIHVETVVRCPLAYRPTMIPMVNGSVRKKDMQLVGIALFTIILILHVEVQRYILSGKVMKDNFQYNRFLIFLSI